MSQSIATCCPQPGKLLFAVAKDGLRACLRERESARAREREREREREIEESESERASERASERERERERERQRASFSQGRSHAIMRAYSLPSLYFFGLFSNVDPVPKECPPLQLRVWSRRQ